MKQKVALVLGSGGARGTAHISVIRELIQAEKKATKESLKELNEYIALP